MIYIKLVICTLTACILASAGDVGNFGTVPQYFLCLSIAMAFTDKDKIRAVVMSVIFALVGSALTDRLLIYCIIMYTVPVVLISEFLGAGFKRGLILVPVLTGGLTVFGELIFYYLFIRGNFAVDFMSVIAKELVINVITGFIIYIILYRIYNPKKRRFKINVR